MNPTHENWREEDFFDPVDEGIEGLSYSMFFMLAFAVLAVLAAIILWWL